MMKPNIQIDDVVREMTDEEYEQFLVVRAAIPTIGIPPVEEEQP
jgi:hypothetical protein